MEHHAIVIIGAGLAGGSTAYHLAQAGQRDVVLLERETSPGVHSSGRNAAILREKVDHPHIQPLATEGADVLRRGEWARFEHTGGLLLGGGDEAVETRVPIASGRALWVPDDGVVEVAALLDHYLRGQDIRYECIVADLTQDASRTILHTSKGELSADIVVNAVGPWAGSFGSIAYQPLNRHVFVTGHMPQVDPRWPFVWDVPNGYYFRPESGGLLLSPCDETPAAPGIYTELPEQLEALADAILTHQPGLGDLQIAHQWVGQRTFTPDRNFAIGFDPEMPRLFHVAGLGGHGMTTSPAVGRLAADLLLHNRPDDTPFSPARFSR